MKVNVEQVMKLLDVSLIQLNTYFVTRLGLEMLGLPERKEGVWMAWWIVWRRMRKIGQRRIPEGF